MAKFFTPSKISDNIRETPEGFLVCIGVPIARTGWQDYGPNETPLEPGSDGRVWIHREAKEVFNPRTIASFQGKSVTIRHPNDFVDPKNWKNLSHGVVQNVRKGDGEDEEGEQQLLADLLITDDIAIGLVKNGLREVSCGYDAEYEETAEGEGKQTNIIGNHVALVEEGRAGPTYAIRDHKDEGKENLMSDVLKELAGQLSKLSKTVDAALAAKPPKKKTVDAEESGEAEGEKKSFDAIMDAVKAIHDKVDGLKVLSGDDKKDGDAKDAESESGSDRIKALEAAVAKILKMLESKSADEGEEEEESEDEGEEEEESEDEGEGEESEEEESEDDLSGDEEGEEGEESQKKTGDAARVELLTPGKKFKGKDARLKCVKAFSETKDGAKVLSSLTGKKRPTIDSKSADHLFLAASTVMRSKRGVGLGGTKDSRGVCVWGDGMDADNNSGAAKTPEEINEANAKHYGLAK